MSALLRVATESCGKMLTYSVISFIGLKGELFLGEELLRPQFLDFRGEDLLWWCGGVNAVRLDGDEHATTLLEEHLGVERNDTGLVRLGNTVIS